MARIIKGLKTHGSHDSFQANVPVSSKENNKVIDGNVYKAQLEARNILNKGEQLRSIRLSEARNMALLIREEALASAAADAFNGAGKRALEICNERAEYLSSAYQDVELLATEIVQKVLGGSMQLDSKKRQEIVAEGIIQLRGKRRVTIQVPPGMTQSLDLDFRSDIVLEENSGIKAGCIRVVTDAGSTICSESAIVPLLKGRQ